MTTEQRAHTTITRLGRTFTVEDGPQTASWHFWNLWADAAHGWEVPLLALIDQLLPDGGLFLDVGAWIGPITLWAAQRGNVIALEPDPEAYRQLAANIAANDLQERVDARNVAADVRDGEATLWSVRGWGESTPSMTLERGEAITVRTIDIAALIAERPPALVKMDIEGQEGAILPAIGPLLRASRTPMLLAIHYGTFDPALVPAFDAELAHWDLQLLPQAGAEYLCTAKD